MCDLVISHHGQSNERDHTVQRGWRGLWFVNRSLVSCAADSADSDVHPRLRRIIIFVDSAFIQSAIELASRTDLRFDKEWVVASEELG